MKPAVDGTISPLQIAIPEEAANSLVEFDASTRYPIASQGTDYLSQVLNLSILDSEENFQNFLASNRPFVGKRGAV